MKLVERKKKLTQMMEVEVASVGPMETNIDPYQQEDESTVGPIKELKEVHVGLNEPSRVVKIGKCLSNELA